MYRTAGGLRVRDRQGSVNQRWSKGRGRQAGSGSGKAKVKLGGLAKRGRETKGADRKNSGKLERRRRTGNKQTENTGINTQGIIGKMGDTRRGVETSTRTGEADQGMTFTIH
jgi:hypothetical protein